MSQSAPSYLELAGLPVHGKLGVVHRAHELDAGRHHEQHLVANAHPEPLQATKLRILFESIKFDLKCKREG